MNEMRVTALTPTQAACESAVLAYVAANPGSRRSMITWAVPHGNGQVVGTVMRLLATGGLVERAGRRLFVSDGGAVCPTCGAPRQ